MAPTATATGPRRHDRWPPKARFGGSHAYEYSAESGKQVIGIAITNPARALGEHKPVRELELSSLYVLSAHHGHGAGQALLDTVLPPGTPAQLWVAERNPRARRFYERNGFTPDGAQFTDDSLGLDELRLVR